MENPGLKRHESPPFLKVTHRRTAAPPPMATPFTNSTGYAGAPPEPATQRENVTTAPAMTGGVSAPAVSATNGLPPLDVNPVRATPPQPDPNKTADQRRQQVQKQVGGGEHENPAYDRAQQNVQQKMQVRRAHPLHQGAYDDQRRQFLYNIDAGPDYYAKDHPPSAYGSTDQPMLQIKEPLDDYGQLRMEEPHDHPSWQGCENCLKDNVQGDQYGPDDAMHQMHSGVYEHPYKPIEDLPAGVRLASSPAGWASVEPEDDVPQVPGGGSVNSFGPLCENCWLNYGIKNPSSERHGAGPGYYFNHEFKPIEPGQRFSAAPTSDDDEYWNGSDYPAAGPCPNCEDDDSMEGEPGRAHCFNCGYTDTPRENFGPLKTRDFSVWDQAHLWGDHGKPGMEEKYPGSGKGILDDVRRGPGDITPVHMQHLNSARTAAQVPNFDDPAYPYSGRVDPEDTTDLENMQSGDDTFRPHHPVVDSVMNQMQGLPDMTRNDPKLMEGVNNILDQYPDTEEGNRGADALSMGLNTIFDSTNETKGMPREERLQRAKDALDAHFEASQLTHKQHVKQLHDDWEARGGHKTGEPRPVERFSPKYTKPQQIVPDPSNPFPELESPILYAGKCEGCGKKLYDSADSSGDPRGALGDHTVGTIDAAEYDATDVPKEERTGERRMHGPSALICPNCDNEQERHRAVEDKYLGHKAGDKTGDGYWGVPFGAPAGTKREFIPTTYGKDRKGKWHNPGEKVGSCPECDKGITGFHRREAGLKDDFVDAARDFRDWTADKPWSMGITRAVRDVPGMMKSLRHPDYYDDEDNLVEEGYHPPEPRTGLTWQDIKSKPRHVRQPTMAQTHPLWRTATAEDDEWWAQQPDVVSTMHHSPDAAGDYFDDEADPQTHTLDDDDWDDLIPDNMSLRDHARLLRYPGVSWDGDDRYPRYTTIHHRKIIDSDGRPAYAEEHHVIEHNTANRGPSLPSEDNPDPHVSSYPWNHTYYPAGQSDDESLVKGYNTADQALRAQTQLSLFGARHPGSKELLKGYRYVGNEMPYDPSVELPHEAAMRGRA